jgi:hypothetical protein
MKLIKFSHNTSFRNDDGDYGDEYAVKIFYTKKWCLFQAYVNFCNDPGWPYVHLSFGMSKLAAFLICFHRFELEIRLLDVYWLFDHTQEDYDG